MSDPNDGDGAGDSPTDRSASSADRSGTPSEGSPAPASAAGGADATDGDALQPSSDERSDDDSAESTGPGANSSGTDHQSVVESVGDPDIAAVLDEDRRLHGRVRILWVARRLIPALILSLVVGFVLFRFEVVSDSVTAAGAGAAVFALVMTYGIVRAVLLYRSWRYVVREDSLYLTRGVFTIVQTIVPYVRVQHIDTRRSALERSLGLASLVVYTAGSRGADVTIPGLTPDRAEKLQSRLKRLAIESEDEDAV